MDAFQISRKANHQSAKLMVSDRTIYSLDKRGFLYAEWLKLGRLTGCRAGLARVQWLQKVL
jgi:hypothetical protein